MNGGRDVCICLRDCLPLLFACSVHDVLGAATLISYDSGAYPSLPLPTTHMINSGAAHANLGMLRKAMADFEAALKVGE